MDHNFNIGNLVQSEETMLQPKDLVLLVANQEVQEQYKKIIEGKKLPCQVLTAASYEGADAVSRDLPISMYFIYPNLVKNSFPFAKKIREARGAAHVIVLVCNPKLKNLVEGLGYKHVDKSDPNHPMEFLDYMGYAPKP